MKKIEIDRSNPHKVSTIFLEYAEPFLELYLSEAANPTPDQMNAAICVPWIIWNACYMQQCDVKSDHVQSFHALIQGAPSEVKQLIDFMVKRRNNQFASHDFFIGDYNFSVNKITNELKFRAESRK